MLIHLFPRAHARFLKLPLLGGLLEGLAQWCCSPVYLGREGGFVPDCLDTERSGNPYNPRHRGAEVRPIGVARRRCGQRSGCIRSRRSPE